MCGIIGGMSFNGTPCAESYEHAINQLRHRGPDDSGLHLINNVALGHTRLSIIDVAGGNQPLKSCDGKLHLVANGEVYNYKEIAKSHSDIKTNTQSDSEAILQVYKKYGLEGFKKLNGMFAFALYDEEAERLVLSRDRLGIKPLYFSETPDGIFFSSEIKALLPLIKHSSDLNPDALVQFLQHQFNTGRNTIFEKIKRVLPGEYLVIQNGKLSFHQYWGLSEIEEKPFSLEEALEEFEPLFDQVMVEHMRSDVPFGLFLSGGIDSSILLAQLSKQHNQPIKTFSIGYSGTHLQDELQASNSLAKQFRTDHTQLQVSRNDLFNRIVHSIWAADDLMRDYACLPTLALSEAAAKDVKVVFSGEGGDEVFAGYRRYAPNAARWIYHKMLRQGVRTKYQWNSSVSNSVFSERLKKCDSKAVFSSLWNATPKNWTLMKKRQLLDINSALADNLFVKTDRMTMAFGLEGRVPLADHRIVEFGFSLPDKLKYQKNRGKWILRQWANKSLPQEHLQKPKRGFYVPVREWLSGDFLMQLGEKLQENRAIQQWFNIDSINEVILSHQAGKNYSREIWGLMQFAIWYQLFVENPGKAPNKIENPLDWI